MIYGYARCSTNEKLQDINRRVRELKQQGATDETIYLEYENVERVAGETSWSFWKLFAYAIEGIVAFTVAPLRMATIFGILVSIIAFLYMLFVFGKALIIGDPVAGYPSMVVIILFLGGIQLLSLGIIGEYLSKTYMEAKKRPKYIIRKKYEQQKEEC